MALTINGTTGIETNTDTGKLKVGTGDDLEIYHDGTKSGITNSTGQLNIAGADVRITNAAQTESQLIATENGAVELYYDNAKQFETVSGGCQFVNDVKFDNNTTGGADAFWDSSAGEFMHYDNVKASWGNSSDLQIYHDGSANRFLLDGETYINNKANTEVFIALRPNAAVELYHDNSKKFETTSGGVASSGQIDINNSAANAVGDLDDPADYGLVLRGSSTTGEGTGIAFTNDDKSAVGSAICHIDNGSNNIGHLAFYTSKTSNTPVENVRITQNGFLKAKGDYSAYISDTDNVHEFNGDTSGETSMRVRAGSSNGNGIQCLVNSDDTTNYYFAGRSLSAASARMYIWSNGDLVNNNNSYGSLSDIKLKENIVDASSQWNDIKNLKVRKFNFKDNPSKPMLGLIAQEAETVSPGLVDSHPDTDAGGDDLGTTTKSVKYSILYMKAIKALQEAIAKIETLETKVAALEAG